MGAFGFGFVPGASGRRFRPSTLFSSGANGAWYDPSDLDSMFQDSTGTVPAAVDAPVGRISDKSGRGNHAVQATAAARPILRKESSGLHYLEFDGTDDFLRASFAIAQPWDRISAARQLGWTQFDRLFGGAAINSGNLYQDPLSPQLRISSGGATGPALGAALGVNTVIVERHHGTASRLAINGGAYAAADGGSTAVDGVTIGSASSGLAGRVGNFRLYGMCMIGRALSDAETGWLRRFMAGRAGLAA